VPISERYVTRTRGSHRQLRHPGKRGTITTDGTRNEVVKLIQEAIEFHVEGLKQDGDPVPEPSSSVEFVEVAA
jgi:hypothetical protein